MIISEIAKVYPLAESESRSIAKIDRFSNLETGWRFGEGVATKPEVSSRARRLVTVAENFGWETDVFPGVSGELLVEIEKGDKRYECILEINGTLTLIRLEDGEDVERVPQQADIAAIDRIRFENSQCAIYAYSTQTIGHLKTEGDLVDWCFVQAPNRRMEYLLSIPDAQRSTAEQFAPTLPRIIGSGTPQPFSGFLRQTTSAPQGALSTPLATEETSGATSIFMIWETMLGRPFSNPINDITDGQITEYAVLEEVGI